MGEQIEWTDYASAQPEAEGPYEWLIPSRACKDMVVHVLANMRERGAGYNRVISPSFDYWDGYRVHVPAGTKWRPTDKANDKSYHIKLLGVVGLELVECQFCHRTPTLHGIRREGRNTVLSSDAHEFNTWWFTCCEWASTPHLSDPRVLEDKRRVALSGSLP